MTQAGAPLPERVPPWVGTAPRRVLHVVDRLDRENAGLSIAPLRIATAQASVGLDVTVAGVLAPGRELPAGHWDGLSIEAVPNGSRWRARCWHAATTPIRWCTCTACGAGPRVPARCWAAPATWCRRTACSSRSTWPRNG